MNKKNLWLCIATSIIGVVNLILYAVLAGVGIVETRWISYMFLIGFFVCTWIPFLLNILFKKNFSMTVLISYQVFLILSLLAGSLWRVYGMWSPFDQIIHFASGVLIALIAYAFFSDSKKSKLSLAWLFVLTFSISMMCGGLWEIWEFVTDGLFGNNAQIYDGFVGRAALFDTMYDIICDFGGAILGGIAAVFIEWRRAGFGRKNKILTEENNSEQNDSLS